MAGLHIILDRTQPLYQGTYKDNANDRKQRGHYGRKKKLIGGTYRRL